MLELLLLGLGLASERRVDHMLHRFIVVRRVKLDVLALDARNGIFVRAMVHRQSFALVVESISKVVSVLR